MIRSTPSLQLSVLAFVKMVIQCASSERGSGLYLAGRSPQKGRARTSLIHFTRIDTSGGTLLIMPILLLSFKRISDSEILIHGALTPNAARSLKLMEQHASDCPKFGPAYRAEETIEQELEIDNIPEFDADAIGDWIDEDLLGGVDDDEEIEEDDDDAPLGPEDEKE